MQSHSGSRINKKRTSQQFLGSACSLRGTTAHDQTSSSPLLANISSAAAAAPIIGSSHHYAPYYHEAPHKLRVKSDDVQRSEKVAYIANTCSLSYCDSEVMLEQACWNVNLAIALAQRAFQPFAHQQHQDQQQQQQQQHQRQQMQHDTPQMAPVPADQDGAKCSICLRAYTDDNLPFQLPTCLHVFHKACLIAWNDSAFSVNRDDAYCAICAHHFDENRLVPQPKILMRGAVRERAASNVWHACCDTAPKHTFNMFQ